MRGRTIFVLGGDGFIGWPLSLRLSVLGAKVVIVDNLSRRHIDTELGTESLVPIASIQERLQTWSDVQPDVVPIVWEKVDIANEYERLVAIFRQYRPTTVIQLAEQRSAPYSMRSSACAQYTLSNNLNSTHNVLQAILTVDRSIHMLHLGTMGVYGYGTVADTVIPEGYLTVQIKNKFGEEQVTEILHPAHPGSVYHLSKTQDALMFQFFAKNYDLRITDLHQGIVWGTSTVETTLHSQLANRFDYDGDYGTVLNRFIVQAMSHLPLTVNGTGEQTRAFIHIENSMQCILLAVHNPPLTSKVSIFNQVTGVARIIDLAERISTVGITYVQNPRKESVANTLEVTHDRFDQLGLVSIPIDDQQIRSMIEYARTFVDRLRPNTITSVPTW